MTAKPRLENYEESIFNFDMIRINSMRSPEELKKILPVDDLKDFATSFKIDNAYFKAKKAGHKTRIDIVNPLNVGLELLLHFEYALYPYAITYLEIAKNDLYQESDPNGSRHFPIGDHFVGEVWATLYKKWNTNHFDYRQERFDPKKRDPSMGSITLYYGKLFELVVYPRLSKTTGTPCIHSEWRCKSSSEVLKKTGIETIQDLINFNCEAKFKELEDRFIAYEKINFLNLMDS